VTARFYVQLPFGGVRSYTTSSYYFQKDIYETGLLPFFRHQLRSDYFKQLNMSTIGNDTVSAFGISPVLGYKLDFLLLFIEFFVLSYRLSGNINNHYDVIILFNNILIYFMTFEIKIYREIPKNLTDRVEK
jgi:hypothetical protein